MRLALLIHEYPPIGGGAATAASQVASAWVRAGHQVLVLTAGDETCYREQDGHGVTVRRLQIRKRRKFAPSSFELLKFCLAARMQFTRQLAEFDPDGILAFFILPAGYFAVRSARRLDVPVVVSLRGSDVPGFSPARLGGLFGSVSRPLMRSTLQAADQIAPNSEHLRDLALQSFPEIQDKITIVRNGVDQRMLVDQPAASNGAALCLVQVGQLIARKRVDLTIQAVAMLQQRGINVRLTIIGMGPTLPELQDLAIASGATDAINFAGFIPRDQIPAILRVHDVYISTSSAEGMSNAMLEAMAAGLPVVTTANGSHDIVSEADCGEVLWQASAAELADRIMVLANSRAERERMATNAIDFAKRHTWDDCANHFLKLIQQVRS